MTGRKPWVCHGMPGGQVKLFTAFWAAGDRR
jgi:hypothetical protein